MFKTFFLSLFSVFLVNIVYAQKFFDVTIKLDSSINPQKVGCYYYDGKAITLLPDTFGNKRVVVLKGKYYSPLASINISYADTANNGYFNDFFVSEKPATINFYYKGNNDNKLPYNLIKNATPIFDTTVNKIWAGLGSYLANTTTNKEKKAFADFDANHKDFLKNDSLTRVFHKLYKAYLNTTMRFLRKYPDDYFSFWYFINQVSQPQSVLANDTAYLREQLAYLKEVFPAKFTASIEGQELIRNYEIKLNPLKPNNSAPPFNITTIDGKKINLEDLKGKYILLDFWATWCPPCMAEIPFIKEIRNKYPSEKLEIIGISQDRDPKPLMATVISKGMDWPHFFDRQKEMSKLYNITLIPTIILIDKEGKIIFKSDPNQDDAVVLPKVLEGLK